MNNKRVKDYLKSLTNDEVIKLVKENILLKKPILVKSTDEDNDIKVEAMLNRDMISQHGGNQIEKSEYNSRNPIPENHGGGTG